MEDLEKLKKELENDAIKVSDVNLLFMDLSSNCTGYCLVKTNFENKSAKFVNAGAIWFDPDWKNQDKYHYLYNAITNYFNIVGQVDYCIAEAYMINTKRLMGCQVGPELHGALQVSLAEIGVKYSTVPVSTWRKMLGIKKNSEGDFKEPTKILVEQYVDLPEKVSSNITGGERNLPNDLTDAIAIALGSLKKLGIDKYDFKEMKIQEKLEF